MILFSLGDGSGYLVKIWKGKVQQYKDDTYTDNIAYDDFELS